MADGYDRFENEGSGGGSFMIGLLTGTVLGAGLAMLFAPKAGSDLRNQISEQAGNFANSASEGYRRASEAAGEWAGRGREMYDKTRDAVARGADEAQRYVREAANNMSASGSPLNSSSRAGSTGSSPSSSSGHESTEDARGTGTASFGGSQSGFSGPRRS
jgi:gas vesicle protein